MNIDEIVQGKLDADAEFQASLADLPDTERDAAIATKRKELTNAEFKALADAKEQNEKIAKDQKLRAEKAEKERDDLKGGNAPAAQAPALSIQDQVALTRANVNVEDIEYVLTYAKNFGLTPAQALETTAVKATLAEKEEHRTTAAAANTGPARPGQRKASDTELMNDLSKGKVPEPGSEEALRIFKARRGRK